jgi:hypothetical protein
MKTMLATAALVVAIASPAFAQVQRTYEPVPGQAYARSWQDSRQDPASAFAQSTMRDRRLHLGNPAWHVYNGAGEYVGTDPDPFIRNELARDPPGRNDD